MREKKIAIIIIIWGTGKHIQSVKRVREHFYGFYCPFFPSTKQSSLMEIIFSSVGFTVQLTVPACPIAMKNVQINISTKKSYSVKHKTETLKENITN